MRKLYFFPFLFLLATLFSCLPQQEQKKANAPIIIREAADAATLNPVSARDEVSQIICMQLFQSLTNIDFNTNEIVGVIASAPPTLELDSSKLAITYQIRPEAKFDDGTPITAKDVAFSLKLNICPLINNVGGANYYGFIKSISLFENDPLKISFHCNEIAVLYEFISGDFAILPQSFYDKNKVLDQFSYAELLTNDSLQYHPTIIEYAKVFNSEEHAFDPAHINGPGPYRLKTWDKNQRIRLEKKEHWWGEKTQNKNSFFSNKGEQLIYEIINDQNTAIVALKSGKVDFMRGISAADFSKLKNSSVASKLKMESTTEFGYQYLGFNLNNPLLADLELRKAIAYLLPKEQIIEKVFYGQATPTNAPLSVIRKDLYNTNLESYAYNPEKALQILTDNEWTDENQDGVLEKIENGKTIECSLRYHYNSGNNEREAVGLILQDELKKVGIQLEVIGIEWSVYLEKLRSGEMELFYGGVSSMPIPPDYTSAFHSISANGGRNYANYQNPKADSLIVAIRESLDKNKRASLVKEFQAIINQDLPYLFLYTPKEQLAYSNKLKNVNIYSLRPYFWPPELSWE